MKQMIREKVGELLKKIMNEELSDTKYSMDNIPSWDSLSHLQLLFAVENYFKIEIGFEDSIKMTNVDTMVEIIEKYVKEQG